MTCAKLTPKDVTNAGSLEALIAQAEAESAPSSDMADYEAALDAMMRRADAGDNG
jgi:hypothetical protein